MLTPQERKERTTPSSIGSSRKREREATDNHPANITELEWGLASPASEEFFWELTAGECYMDSPSKPAFVDEGISALLQKLPPQMEYDEGAH